MRPVNHRAVALCCAAAITLSFTASAAAADQSTGGDPQAPADIVRSLGAPTLQPQSGPTPQTMRVTDVMQGSGPAIQAGDTGIIQYTVLDWRTGRVLERLRGGTAAMLARVDYFDLVPGWWQGIQGMQVGGRRALTLPPILALGNLNGVNFSPGVDQATYHVIDLLGIRPQTPPGPPPAEGLFFNIWGQEYDPVTNPLG